MPYRIEVKPGNATVPKGADQTIVATLNGFDGEDVVVMVQARADERVRADSAQRQTRTAPTKASSSTSPRRSSIHRGGRRPGESKHYTLKVVDLPYVQQLNLEYHFPAYTGLEPQKIEDGGDVAALRGTEVHVQITPTMKTTGGRLLVNDKYDVELALQKDGTLTGSFKADADGFYRVELNAPNGEKVAGVAAVHDRRADRRRAERVVQASRARHVGVADRRSVRRGERRRRLRRAQPRAGVLGERRRPRRW